MEAVVYLVTGGVLATFLMLFAGGLGAWLFGIFEWVTQLDAENRTLKASNKRLQADNEVLEEDNDWMTEVLEEQGYFDDREDDVFREGEVADDSEDEPVCPVCNDDPDHCFKSKCPDEFEGEEVKAASVDDCEVVKGGDGSEVQDCRVPDLKKYEEIIRKSKPRELKDTFQEGGTEEVGSEASVESTPTLKFPALGWCPGRNGYGQ